ncbi:MAG: CDP-alcohol phosphatidyltransferase family protein [Paracoccaceae bacterium]
MAEDGAARGGKGAKRRVSVYTISNALSVYRLLAAPAVAAAALSGHRTLFVTLAMISLFTDAIDGVLARWRHEETPFGARLDALADSLTLIAGLTGVWVFERAPFLDNPFWLGLFLASLALAVAVSLVRFRKLPAFHLYAFKAADIGMIAFFATLFLYGFLPWAYALSLGFAALAALEIAALALVIPTFRTDLKGLYWVLKERRTP